MPEHEPAFASPDDLPAPAGYSHVVSIPPGRLVWTSGQVGMDADGTVPDGLEAQTRLAFANVGRALRAAGAGWDAVVKLTYYVVDVSDLPTVRAVRDEVVRTDRPRRARSCRSRACSVPTCSWRWKPWRGCPEAAPGLSRRSPRAPRPGSAAPAARWARAAASPAPSRRAGPAGGAATRPSRPA